MRAVLIPVILTLTACVEEPPMDGRIAFIENCAGCHGTDAKGGGSFGNQLIKTPPDLTHLSKRNGGVFPRDYVMSTIDGLTRKPHFSAAMPEFGAGNMGEVVMVEQDGLSTPVPAMLLALADYLEGVQE